jgi:response regulator RpfG family c-di-GMP phosphodiesterase
MALVLVVDDHADARYLLSSIFASHGHEVIEASNGAEGLRAAEERRPNVVISDVLMPVMDGFEFCGRLREMPGLRDVPFIFYTATYTRPDERRFALSVGANLYFEKPTDPLHLLEKVESLLDGGAGTPQVAHMRREEFDEQHLSIVSRKLEQKVAELEHANAELRAGEARLRQTMTGFVSTIDRIIEYRDPYTAGHEHRVGLLAAAIGREMGLEASRVEGLMYGGFVHDVGKIFAPAEILTRPGRLSDVEMAMVRTHARVGYDILKDVEFPWPIAQMALQHHERWDGSGYPDGLAGEEIMLEARILAVADVVESMASHRPYRPSLGLDAALAEIDSGSGKRYDPDAAAACLRLFRQQGYQMPQ